MLTNQDKCDMIKTVFEYFLLEKSEEILTLFNISDKKYLRALSVERSTVIYGIFQNGAKGL